MPVYTVHAPGAAVNADEAAERSEFVPEKFSWVALFFAPFWMLWHGLWLVFLGWAVVEVGIALLGVYGSVAAASLLSPLWSLFFALVANDLRRWTLDRRGYRLAGIVCGANRTEAEIRYFSGLAAAPDARRPPPPPFVAAPDRTPAVVGFSTMPEIRPEFRR
jgi:hypothetical protein